MSMILTKEFHVFFFKKKTFSNVAVQSFPVTLLHMLSDVLIGIVLLIVS